MVIGDWGSEQRVRLSRARCLVVLVVGCLSLQPSRPAYALDEVLVRYIAWRGGAAFAHLRRFDARGSFTDGQQTGSILLAADIAGDLRDELTLGSIASSVVATRLTGEVTNLSGQSLSLSPAELSFAHDFSSLLLPDELSGGSVERQADTSTGGNPAAVFRVKHAFGAETDYLIAPGDGTLLAIRVLSDGGWRTLTLSDWHLVDGVRMPFSIAEQGEGAIGPLDGDDERFAFHQITINRPFHPALPLHKLIVHIPSGGSGWIPFRMKGDLILLDASVNGRQTTAMLDSGAGLTTLDATFARALGLVGVGAGNVAGMGGVVGLSYTPGLHVEIAGTRFTGITAGVLDLSSMLKMGLPLRFVLGAEIFNQVAVDIDYPNKRIAFRPPGDVGGEIKRHVGASVLPLHTFEAAFTSPISVDRRGPIPVQLDTGNNGVFNLYPAYWQSVASLAEAPGTMALTGGAGGFAPSRQVDVPRLRLGSVVLSDVPATLDAGGRSATGSNLILGNLGDAALRRFRVIFDVPDGRLVLIPGPHVGTPFPRNLVGLQTVPDGTAARVLFVMPHSPALEAGMRKGDEILDVDGQPAPVDFGSSWGATKEGQVIQLHLRDGRRITIRTRRFY